MNHYSLDVTVTDAILNHPHSTKRTRFITAVLANNEDEARSMAQDFYSRSGFGIKVVKGIQTLFRSAPSNIPGSIRTVQVSNIQLVPEPVQEVIIPNVVIATPVVPTKSEEKELAAARKKAAAAEKAAAKVAEKKQTEAQDQKKEDPQQTTESAGETETIKEPTE